MLPASRCTSKGRALQSRLSVRSRTLSQVPTAFPITSTLPQRREFRFCPWGSSHVDSGLHREARRRHRMFRYRYIESINRRLSWDNRPPSDSTEAVVKKASGQTARPTTELSQAEREAANRILRAEEQQTHAHEVWKAPLNNIRNYLNAQRSPKEANPEEVLQATASGDNTTATIDPITNRKIQSSSFTPKYEDVDNYGPVRWNEPDGLQKPTSEEQSKIYSDLDKYTSKIDDPSAPLKLTPEEESKHYDDLHKYNPVRWNEPDGLPNASPEEVSKQYDDLAKYKPATWNEPDGLPKATAEETSKNYDDLDQYKPVKWNEPDGLQGPTTEELSKNYDDLGSYNAIKWNEPDGLPKPTAEELSKNYNDLNQYKPVRWNEPDGLPTETPEELSKKYDDLHRYGAVRWNEPDGLQKPTPEELSKNYDDLHKYGAVRWNEPDGLRKLTPEEESKFYTDLSGYKAVVWNEPDGLPQLTPEEKSKKYTDLGNYGEPFDAKDSVLKQYEATQQDTTPRGEPLPSKVDAPSYDPSEEYKDLDKYGPVRWNEPDGLQQPTSEELSKNYDDLHKYGAVRWNEPDGLPGLTAEERSKLYKDLTGYEAKISEGPEVVPDRRHPEEASKDYKDLGSYGPVEWNEPDGLRTLTPEEISKRYKDLPSYDAAISSMEDAPARRHPEEISKDYDDLHKYAARDTEIQTPRIHPEEASKRYRDLHLYSAAPDGAARIHPEEASKAYQDLSKYGYQETNETQFVHPEELTKIYDDLKSYSPTDFDSITEEYPPHPEELTKNYEDLDKYTASRYNEPDGLPLSNRDAAARNLDSYDAKTRAQQQRIASTGRHRGRSNKFSTVSIENASEWLESLTAQDIRDGVLRKARANSQKQKLEEDKARSESTWDAVSVFAQETLNQAKSTPSRKLTGSFVRDFPEEFAGTWTTASSSSDKLLPKDQAGTASVQPSSSELQAAMKDDVEISSMDESFPAKPSTAEVSKLEPALNRQLETRSLGGALSHLEKIQAHRDPYSKAPQGLETNYEEECGGTPTWPALVKHYKAPDNLSKAVQTSGMPTENPMLYKVLAFDSATQTVRIAETSSAINDGNTAASPAEVMLRLSNPAKFFPHFSSLQTQGYEMVSGKDDVLVFRKARPATDPSAVVKDTTLPTHSPPINPVDMMGKPVTGNFASPTGFVNYNSLAEEATDKPAPPFRSNIDVRREEPVFSGPKAGRQDSRRASFGRKVVIGTAGMVGTAYAVGVMGQYFVSGGA